MNTSAMSAGWDVEVDFVSIGSGIGGLAGAITAYDQGMSTVVLEKAALVGGVTAYSYGEVWVAANHLQEAAGIEDSQESGLRYCEWLSMGFGDEEQIRNYIVHSPIALKYFEERAGLRWHICKDFADYYWPQHEDTLEQGRFIEVEPFPAASLGEWQEKSRMSPHAPPGVTHDDMFEQGGAANILNWDFEAMGERMEKDERTLGPGLAAYFVKAALDRQIPLYTETPAVALVTEGDRVIGVKAQRDGKDFFVRADKGVLIAAGSYDGSSRFDHLYDHRGSRMVSAVPPSVTGDNLILGGSVGAMVGQVPTPHWLGFHIPGEEHDGVPLWRMSIIETGLPHGILVNQSGRRFGDESFYRTIGHNSTIIEGGDQTLPNVPCWFVFDSQYHEKYPLGSLLP
ncbi:FAD-binding protein, partial [bacterium]|nr:FAD-binding protein [bacterium]